jgi:lipopolysaccharide transport system ATP-binding protein
MTAPVIHAEALSKQYCRGLATDPGLRHALDRLVKSPLSVFRRQRHETFFALNNVSLDVREGEVLGLIGRNGAGKTTLLKILSKITRPTSGWAEIHGRVGSLLEVGTGFHPELTGRENAFLSGAILGMGKAEITRKFDEIVAFAELEKFIDTPVKHYSSGMYVRLAFAVAAHLEPEILLVDEVLAVGDINFQKKCLGKMGDVARAGRTIVLVTHQLNQIRRLCQRVLWIDAGSVRLEGNTQQVVAAYESAMASGNLSSPDGNRATPQGEPASGGRWLGWRIVEPLGDQSNVFSHIGLITLEFTLKTYKNLRRANHGIALFNRDAQLIWAWGKTGVDLPQGEHSFRYTFPMLPLRPGPYTWKVSLNSEDGAVIDYVECIPEMIVALDPLTHPRDEWSGILNIPSEFSILTESHKS